MASEKRDWGRDGLPAWIWPSAITTYSLLERLLAGLGVGRFYDLNTSPNNYLPQVLGIVLSGFIGNSWMKKVEERKMVAAENPPPVVTSDPPSALKVTTTASTSNQ
jgi:hypothetical protein